MTETMSTKKLMQQQDMAMSNGTYNALMWDAKLVALALNVGQRTLWRWIAAGIFPAPDLSIGAKIRRWRRETVLNWIEQQVEVK